MPHSASTNKLNHRTIRPAIPVAAALLISQGAFAGTIDGFTDFQIAIDNDPNPAISSSSATTGSAILGGQRDINANTILTTGAGTRTAAGIAEGKLEFSSDSSARGVAIVQWDGPDNTITLDPTGLQGFDLTEGGLASAIRFQLEFADLAGGFDFTLSAYSDASNYTIAEFKAPQVLDGSTAVSVEIPLSAFSCSATPANLGNNVQLTKVTCGGNGVNLANLGALELRINSPATQAALDMRMTAITTVKTKATLGNYTWEDTNNNGLQEAGEPGIDGITVNLLNPGADGLCGTGNESIIGTTSTGDNPATGIVEMGYYQFSNLEPGNYCVQIVKPNGYQCTKDNQGADNALDSDMIDQGNGTCQSVDPVKNPIMLAAGDSDQTWDGGLYLPAQLGDYVWDDTAPSGDPNDANGIQDNGEPPLGGVTVELYRCENGTATGDSIDSKTTDNLGLYRFTDLAPGQYAVKFTALNGMVFSLADQGGNDAKDSDANQQTGMSPCVTLASGDINLDLDAGLNRPRPARAALGDFVWHDMDADGKYDAGEPGISLVNVELFRCVGGVKNGSTGMTQATNNDGGYLFSDLEPGEYFVTFYKPAGYNSFSPKDAAGDDSIDSDANTANGESDCVTLAAGVTNRDVDAGLYNPASLGDLVWHDLNRNGIQENGEPGLNGVTVELLKCVNGMPNGVLATTGTVNGVYGFTGLMPGDYAVRFTAPAGYQFSPADQGGNDSLDSDAVTLQDAFGTTACTTLSSGEHDDTMDAGLNKPAVPAIDIRKQEEGSDSRSVNYGSDVNFEIVVKNTGNVDLVDVKVSDPLVPNCDYYIGAMTIAQIVTYNCTAMYVTDNFTNIAYVIGKSTGGVPVSDNDPSSVIVMMQNVGTGTPGYWKNHPEAWPVDQIVIGGVIYSKAEAISRMNWPDGDKTVTIFRSLVSAKLNVMIGTNPSCISSTIAAADAWMAANGPIGSKVRASSDAWKIGEPLYKKLDDYNNGLLCAPHRG